jgi:small subunit ribosomal protein S6
MSVYETIFIVKTSATDEEAATLIAKVRAVIEKHGGEVMKVENWGKKKLAYEVRKEKKGTYVFYRFRGPGSLVAELERQYRVEDAIIKFLTVKCDPKLLAEEMAREHAASPSSAAGHSESVVAAEPMASA